MSRRFEIKNCCENCRYATNYTGYDDFVCGHCGSILRAERFDCEYFMAKYKGDIIMSSRSEGTVCSCYKNGRCLGTKEVEVCNCKGNTSVCDFYPQKRNNKTAEDIMQNVDNISDTIKEISDKLVTKYCKDLEDLMSVIKEQLQNNGGITDAELEFLIMDLANALYFTGSAQEDLGIKEDTCKAIRQEVYSKAREQATGKTVADKTAQAELIAQTETMTLAIYSRAYKKVKLRMDAGYEMLNSLKKVMNKRIAEMELSNSRYINKSEVN